jgi:hypothetical protein
VQAVVQRDHGVEQRTAPRPGRCCAARSPGETLVAPRSVGADGGIEAGHGACELEGGRLALGDTAERVDRIAWMGELLELRDGRREVVRRGLAACRRLASTSPMRRRNRL